MKSRSVVSDFSRPHGLQPTRLLHPWDFPGKSTGMGCHSTWNGNANQNHSEIPLPDCQDVYHQKRQNNKSQQENGKKGTLIHYQWEYKLVHWNGLPFPSPMKESENSTEVPQGIKNKTTINPTSEYIPKENKIISKRLSLLRYSFNSQSMKITHVSINR